MIVALTGVEGDRAVADLAEDLAMLRVADGKRVLLVSPHPCAYDARLYDDLVVDASPQGAPASDASLTRASVILTLVQPESLEQPDAYASLLSRLQLAQRTNPAARLLVTVAHGRRPLTAHQTGCLLVFVAQLPQARLADMLVLDDSADAYHTRHSELEIPAHKQERKLCAPEIRNLYREIFRPAGRI